MSLMKPRHATAWQRVRPPRFARVTASAQFDVVVIGGGIAGVTAAYLLKRAGKKVCLLERDRLGAVDTGHTTAHLTYVTDLRLPELVKSFGKDGARMAWEGGAAAINTIEEARPAGGHRMRLPPCARLPARAAGRQEG